MLKYDTRNIKNGSRIDLAFTVWTYCTERQSGTGHLFAIRTENLISYAGKSDSSGQTFISSTEIQHL